ncbi:DUF4625 domain-containing protein [Tunicatimonas pelagia]|uniref:DUF4625 domain-containing protein n=1 Tax=Tunicatimonas pelagia TaxID=931531 RepID=UPI0026667B9F|nr:DUF4625 domain-containing protein [Tunicatimonas pelagia]WKN44173.1 DUF4625 domain-containing protein [Tunicatimonas pelagia]
MIKRRVVLLSAVFATGVIFASCEEDETVDTQGPAISGLEVGHDGELHVGEDVHLEFTVTDNNLLAYYEIEIHAEGEDHDHGRFAEEHWEFEQRFTEVDGLRNLDVHHHEPCRVTW